MATAFMVAHEDDFLDFNPASTRKMLAAAIPPLMEVTNAGADLNGMDLISIMSLSFD